MFELTVYLPNPFRDRVSFFLFCIVFKDLAARSPAFFKAVLADSYCIIPRVLPAVNTYFSCIACLFGRFPEQSTCIKI